MAKAPGESDVEREEYFRLFRTGVAVFRWYLPRSGQNERLAMDLLPLSETIHLPYVQRNLFVFAGDAAAEPRTHGGVECRVGVTAVVNLKEEQAMVFMWSAEMVIQIRGLFRAGEMPESRAHVGIIALFEAFAMVMATYG